MLGELDSPVRVDERLERLVEPLIGPSLIVSNTPATSAASVSAVTLPGASRCTSAATDLARSSDPSRLSRVARPGGEGRSSNSSTTNAATRSGGVSGESASSARRRASTNASSAILSSSATADERSGAGARRAGWPPDRRLRCCRLRLDFATPVRVLVDDAQAYAASATAARQRPSAHPGPYGS
jgi:hypothetical protein